MKTIGYIYKGIAYECLESWHEELTRDERTAIIESGDFDKIESLVRAKNSIDAAITEISERLSWYHIYLPDNFSEIIYSSNTPNADLEDVTVRVGRNSIFTDQTKANIALNTIEKVHNQWIRDNIESFADKTWEQKLKFLPVECIGYREMLKDYIFVRPILQLLHLRPETYLIETAYDKMQENTIHGYQTTQGYIKRELKNLDPKILGEDITKITGRVKKLCPKLR